MGPKRQKIKHEPKIKVIGYPSKINPGVVNNVYLCNTCKTAFITLQETVTHIKSIHHKDTNVEENVDNTKQLEEVKLKDLVPSETVHYRETRPEISDGHLAEVLQNERILNTVRGKFFATGGGNHNHSPGFNNTHERQSSFNGEICAVTNTLTCTTTTIETQVANNGIIIENQLPFPVHVYEHQEISRSVEQYCFVKNECERLGYNEDTVREECSAEEKKPILITSTESIQVIDPSLAESGIRTSTNERIDKRLNNNVFLTNITESGSDNECRIQTAVKSECELVKDDDKLQHTHAHEVSMLDSSNALDLKMDVKHEQTSNYDMSSHGREETYDKIANKEYIDKSGQTRGHHDESSAVFEDDGDRENSVDILFKVPSDGGRKDYHRTCNQNKIHVQNDEERDDCNNNLNEDDEYIAEAKQSIETETSNKNNVKSPVLLRKCRVVATRVVIANNDGNNVNSTCNNIEKVPEKVKWHNKYYNNKSSQRSGGTYNKVANEESVDKNGKKHGHLEACSAFKDNDDSEYTVDSLSKVPPESRRNGYQRTCKQNKTYVHNDEDNEESNDTFDGDDEYNYESNQSEESETSDEEVESTVPLRNYRVAITREDCSIRKRNARLRANMELSGVEIANNDGKNMSSISVYKDNDDSESSVDSLSKVPPESGRNGYQRTCKQNKTSVHNDEDNEESNDSLDGDDEYNGEANQREESETSDEEEVESKVPLRNYRVDITTEDYSIRERKANLKTSKEPSHVEIVNKGGNGGNVVNVEKVVERVKLLVTAKTKEEIANDMVDRININGMVYECALCRRHFQEYKCCKNHVLSVHKQFYFYGTGSEVYTCPSCTSSFATLQRFDQHLERHKIFKFKCIKCHNQFNTQPEYNKHRKKSHSKPIVLTDSQVFCSKCKMIHNCGFIPDEHVLFAEKKKQRCHPTSQNTASMTKNEKKGIEENKSELLQIKLYENSNEERLLTNPIFSKVQFNGKTFVCLFCMEKFESINCCTSHILFQHDKKEEKKCMLCGLCIKSTKPFVDHLKTSHSIQPVYCKNCFAGFNTLIELNLHLKGCKNIKNRKTDLNENICKLCLQPHIQYRTCVRDIQSCETCHLGFEKISCYRNHQYVEHTHRDMIVLSTRNAFICPCGKRFTQRGELHKHVKKQHRTFEYNRTISDKEEISAQSKIKPKGSTRNKNNSINQRTDSKQNDNKKVYSKTEQDEIDKWAELNKAWKLCQTCTHLHIVSSKTSKVVNSHSKITCDTCKHSFNSRKCLQHHELVNHPKKHHIYQCVQCNFYFPNSKMIDCHRKGQDDSTRNKKLITFSKNCSSRKADSVQPCKLCLSVHGLNMIYEQEEHVYSKKGLNDILKSTTKGVILSCKRPTCKLTFTSVEAYQKHKQEKHINIPKYMPKETCSLCKKGFGNVEDLYQHVYNDHATVNFIQGAITVDDTKAFECNYCPRTFQFDLDAQLHLNTEHFGKPLVIIKHKNKMFCPLISCPICTETFLTKSDFVEASSKNKVGCCKTSIKQHIRDHFFKRSIFKRICDKCGNTIYSCKCRAHGFTCSVCQKVLTKRRGLEKHMRVHSDKRLFTCQECGKDFKHESNLTSHERTHLEKSESCPVCDMKFTLRHHVRAHLKRKHNVI